MVFGCILKNFPDRDRDRRRDLVKHRSRSQIFLSRLHMRSRDRRFATSRRRSRSRSSAISQRRDRDQRRDLATARSRSTATGMFAGKIAIGADWSSEFTGDRWIDWNVSSPLARARALSLSVKFSRNTLKGKQKCKMISVVKGIFFRSTDFNFRKIEFSGPTKQPHFQKSISGNDFHPKQTQPKQKMTYVLLTLVKRCVQPVLLALVIRCVQPLVSPGRHRLYPGLSSSVSNASICI